MVALFSAKLGARQLTSGSIMMADTTYRLADAAIESSSALSAVDDTHWSKHSER